MADISNGTGFYISDNMLAGQANITFSSGYTWPSQQKPSKQDWAQWQLGLQQAIPVDNLGCFQKPLGKWLLQWDKHPNQWHWLLQMEPLGLYHWQDRWQLHSPLTNHATCQLKFCMQSRGATQSPPPMAIQVTCTVTRTHIIPSGGQASLASPDQQQQRTWAEHLQQLSTDKRWAFSHLTLLNQGLPLAIAIRLGKARAASNGSFKN